MDRISKILRGVALHEQPFALSPPGSRAALQGAAGFALPLVSPVRHQDGAAVRDRQAEYQRGWNDGQAKERSQRDEAQDAAQAQASQRGFEEGQRKGQAQGRIEGLQEAKAQADRTAAQTAEAAQAAHAAAVQQTRQYLERLDAMVNQVAAQAIQVVADAEEDMVALAHEALCRILGQEAVNAVALRSMVAHLLEQHGHNADLVAHVHPDDFEVLAASEGPANRKWNWAGDTSVKLGGVILRSAHGSLDARLEVQLRAIGMALTEARVQRKVAASVQGAAS